MIEPVLTIYGNTFDKEAILNYIKYVPLDPVCKGNLRESDVIPNLNLKHSIEAFLEANPWAYEYRPNETFDQIRFD